MNTFSIISDFSKTFTAADMPSTWSSMALSGILGDTYNQDRKALYDIYYIHEKNGNIGKTKEWFEKHLSLLRTYNMSDDMIRTIVMNDMYFKPREGVDVFLRYIAKYNIPLTIVSSGIIEFIRMWFLLRYDYVPHIIVANTLSDISGNDRADIYVPMSKSIVVDATRDTTTVLIGDNILDAQICLSDISFGFCDDDLCFTHTLGKNGTMSDVIRYIEEQNM